MAYSFRLTSFLHAKEAVLQVGLVLGAFLAACERRSSREGLQAYFPLWCACAVAVGGGALRARAPSLSIETGSRLAAVLLMASLNYDLLRNRRWRWRIYETLTWSAVLVAVLGIVQYYQWAPRFFPHFPGYEQRVYSVFGNQDLFGGYLALAFPLAVYGPARRSRFLVLRSVALGILCFGLVLSGSRSAWLAAALGAALCYPYRRETLRRRRVVALAFIVSLSFSLAFTWTQSTERIAGTFSVSDKGGHARLWFWDGALRMIRARPFLGVGLGNYAYWSPWYLGEALHAPGGTRHYWNEQHTEHAHCEPLEWYAETGLPGVFFAGWMLFRLLRRRGAAWGGLAALLVFCLFNAGLHCVPHALAGALFAGMLLAGRAAPQGYIEVRCSGVRRWALCAGALAVSGVWVWTVLIPSYLLSAAEDAHTAAQARSVSLEEAGVLRLYARALEHGWYDPAAAEEYGFALVQAGRPAEAYAMFRRALASLDTGSLYLHLGETALALGDLAAAREWFEACLFRWPGNLRAWQCLQSLAPAERKKALADYARRWRLPLAGGVN